MQYIKYDSRKFKRQLEKKDEIKYLQSTRLITEDTFLKVNQNKQKEKGRKRERKV